VPQDNEICSTCNICSDVQQSLRDKLIDIADAKLYNARFELNRFVDFELYLLLRAYSPMVKNICKDMNCNFCYGWDTESVIERVKILTVA